MKGRGGTGPPTITSPCSSSLSSRVSGSCDFGGSNCLNDLAMTLSSVFVWRLFIMGNAKEIILPKIQACWARRRNERAFHGHKAKDGIDGMLELGIAYGHGDRALKDYAMEKGGWRGGGGRAGAAEGQEARGLRVRVCARSRVCVCARVCVLCVRLNSPFPRPASPPIFPLGRPFRSPAISPPPPIPSAHHPSPRIAHNTKEKMKDVADKYKGRGGGGGATGAGGGA